MGSRAASRYAKSLLSLAIEQKVLEDVNKDMSFVASTCKSSSDLMLLLKSPIVKTDKKRSILNAIFSKKVGKLVLSFLEIITKKKRESIILDIALAFTAQYNSHKNITSAKVSTAVALDKDLKSKIMEIVKTASKGEVEIEEEINKELIGGFVIKIGDQQVDSSIQSKLQKLKREFSTNS
ncbi:MAG: ATP synthase F1 subunit delta [Flavobacteriales bacterium]|nr:ATP synthase F1 subunit delta [Flavobacteriales bacterium]